jgi:excinuclease UvrABC ATPase subunit
MIRHLGSSLTDVTYVFDEPTIGLHPHDIAAHERAAAAAARQGQHRAGRRAQARGHRDRGPRRRPRPGAGTAGGEIVFEGTVEGLRASDTLTGRHLDDRASLKASVRSHRPEALRIRGATHNLQDVDVDIPLGVLVVVTGVAGSGKSSLIHGSVSDGRASCRSTRAPIKGSRRSNPATYTGLLEPIRKAFAKANDVKPALFSANSEGACPTATAPV